MILHTRRLAQINGRESNKYTEGPRLVALFSFQLVPSPTIFPISSWGFTDSDIVYSSLLSQPTRQHSRDRDRDRAKVTGSKASLATIPPAMRAFCLLPASVANLVLASPAVYILAPSGPALTAVSSALTTLGYSSSEDTASGPGLGLDPSTYAVLASGTAYKNISRDNPEARFILPAAAADSSSWLGAFFGDSEDIRPDDAESIRAFFAEMETSKRGASQLIELDVFARGSHVQAETWVTLCDFLGLGYSVVERLKLWHFPQ